MVLLGIAPEDTQEDIQWLGKKMVNMRIFPDENEVMNKSLLDIDGEILLISSLPCMQVPRRETDLLTLPQPNLI